MENFFNIFWRLQFPLLLWFSYSSVASGITGDSVGCLYQNGICQVKKEWCYDDGIFGQCIPFKTESFDPSSILHRNSIGEVELSALEASLKELEQRGYKWNDNVTQCAIQRLFFYMKNKSNTPDICLKSKFDENNEERKTAKKKRKITQEPFQNSEGSRQTPIYLSRNYLRDIEDDLYAANDQSSFIENQASKEFDKSYSRNANALLRINKNNDQSLSISDEYPYRLYKDAKQKLSSLQVLSSVRKDRTYNDLPKSVVLLESENYDLNLPLPASVYTGSQFERQERLDVKKPGPWFSVNNYAFQQKDEESGNPSGTWAVSNESPILKEYVSTSRTDDTTPRRRPNLRKNNYLIQPENEEEKKMSMEKLLNKSKHEKDKLGYFLTNKMELPSLEVIKGNHDSVGQIENSHSTTKKQPNAKFTSPALEIDEGNIETNYIFFTIKGEFLNWTQGADFVKVICELLKIPYNTLYDIRVHQNKVSFRILTNDKDQNPSLIASKADEMRLKIQQITGLQLETAGSEDKMKVLNHDKLLDPINLNLSPTLLPHVAVDFIIQEGGIFISRNEQSSVSSVLFWGQENQQMILTIGFWVLTTTVLITAGIMILLRNRHLARKKLKEFTQSADTVATRDYQDLCRARMAIKGSPAEPNKDSSKMPHALLSRDSESSRSSTSSWCEEPVLTNMDISTGHIVLSYMEDHLRNKFRLDQEWQALSSYEAEYSTCISVASKLENNGKNRYGDVLPFDHSRVVLNILANTSGSDYINASSISDHDPRHPAYIATQSPVAESISDFWQMVWEQGSVVLVLLTKIIENGEELCQKYWPEEGSQLYHIYEVHLVSEHIWCDDYLVRSFYLKNIRTGETRTVTQFHFQSWPENGVPSSTKALLEFRRKVNKSYRGRSCPIVVHCSDGAGRTGTYCLIDMVLHRMAKGAREIDIAATLEHLRDQRPHAVRTKQQFEFVLTAVAEEVHAILRALPQ